MPCVDLEYLGLPPPDLIKIDVEATASAVIGSVQKQLFENRPVVFIALHREEQRTKCVAFLRVAGYAICDLESNL